MLKIFYPYEYVDSVFSIDYNKLYELGYKGVLFDLDNTLTHHGEDSTIEIDKLFKHIHKIGIKTIILSDNTETRIQRFLKNIDSVFNYMLPGAFTTINNTVLYSVGVIVSLSLSGLALLMKKYFLLIIGLASCVFTGMAQSMIALPATAYNIPSYTASRLLLFFTLIIWIDIIFRERRDRELSRAVLKLLRRPVDNLKMPCL